MQHPVTDLIDVEAQVSPTSVPGVGTLPPPSLRGPAPLSTPLPSPLPSDGSPVGPTPAAPTCPSPAVLVGPATILSADPSTAPLDQSVPAVPALPALAPPVTNTAAASLSTHVPLTLDDLLGPRPPVGAHGAAATARRVVTRIVLLAIVVALGGAGYLRGPALYDRYVRGIDPADGPVETAAPLAFPTVTTPMPAVRTAEFVLEGLPGGDGTVYHVMTDFETDVSRVDVTRARRPDLEILTFGDAALIRRSDATQWYQVERGRFPLDDRFERSDWIRHLDELLPPTVRSAVTIEAAGDTTVAGVPVRHLTLSLDDALLGDPGAVTDIGPLDPAATPISDPALAATPLPSTPAIVAPADSSSSIPAAPSGSTATASVGARGTVGLEIWVDSTGVIRKLTGAPQFGAETITVLGTDSTAWIPQYPSAEMIRPLTADSLVELGI